MKISTTVAFIIALALHLILLALLALNISLDKPQRPNDSSTRIMQARMISGSDLKKAQNGNKTTKKEIVSNNKNQEEIKKRNEDKLKAQKELEKQVALKKAQEIMFHLLCDRSPTV